MSFKKSTGDRFRPSIDPFGGRGVVKGGLSHGGAYNVDYVIDKSAQKKRRKGKAQGGLGREVRSFLSDAPPVVAPQPTAQEEARMRSATGENENHFKNIVTGANKEQIREALKGFTCFRQAQEGYVEDCGGIHAMWQVKERGNCEAGAEPLDKLQKCADGTFSFGRCVNFRLDENNSRENYLRDIAGQYASELEDAISSCVATAVDFKYGCTDESATNFDSDADAGDGSCVFEGQSSDDSTGETSQEANGDFPDASMPPPVNGDFPELQPFPSDNMNKAGVLGGTNPLAIIGFVAIAAVILVMANRKPAQPVTA